MRRREYILFRNYLNYVIRKPSNILDLWASVKNMLRFFNFFYSLISLKLYIVKVIHM